MARLSEPVVDVVLRADEHEGVAAGKVRAAILRLDCAAPVWSRPECLMGR
jgi:hypothetical protein